MCEKQCEVCSTGFPDTFECFRYLVPPTSVQLYHGSELLSDGGMLVLTSQHERHNYACMVHVDGDSAQPHVSVVLDGQDLTGKMVETMTYVTAWL